MKKKIKSNSGFTLVELIIAMAILALLMTVVSTIMGISLSNSKKTKADVSIQATAHDVYNRIADSIMQAQSIVIKGYTCSNDISFKKSGETTTEALSLCYLVRDNDTKNALVSNPSNFGISETVNAGDVKLFSDMKVGSTFTKVYVSGIFIKRAIPIDLANIPSVADTVVNEDVVLTVGGTPTTVSADHKLAADSFDGGATKVVYCSVDGYSTDVALDSFYFDKDGMYYGVQYAFMTSIDDVVDMSDALSRDKHFYTNALSYVSNTSGGVTTNLTACTLTVDSSTASIDLTLNFNQKNMTFTSEGKVNTRNAFVLRTGK